MGRKKFSLASYLITHPAFHLYLRRHHKLDKLELANLLYRNQSQFASEFKWLRRTFGTVEFIAEALSSLPTVLNEIQYEGLDDPDALRPITCNCPFCGKKKPKRARRIPPAESPPLQVAPAAIPQPGETSVTSRCIHDQLCLRVIARQLLIASFRDAQPILLQPGVREPVFNAHIRTDESRARVLVHAQRLCQIMACNIAKLSVEKEAVARAQRVITALRIVDKHTRGRGGPVTMIPIPPKPFISSHCFRQFKRFTQPVYRMNFPLSRPNQFMAPFRSCHSSPDNALKITNSLFQSLSVTYQEPTLDNTPAGVIDAMQRTGCLELLVSLAAVTGCGSMPLDHTILPEPLRLPPPGDPREIAHNWKRLCGPWVSAFTESLDLEWGPQALMQMVQQMQHLQVEKLCDHLLGDFSRSEQE
eukprot:gnl/Dysnectes_brevis/225_a256_4223.p1 GENE.gnl/Dysnectes_brevis/225_a256_4223~~gnl/Dysnectes_brevis/225_a256_4223.p1  ORF type:complete len:417 (+),score=85.15 gnl/Dysnectes_brevis/225_a256_4223:498-1748(+)